MRWWVGVGGEGYSNTRHRANKDHKLLFIKMVSQNPSHTIYYYYLLLFFYFLVICIWCLSAARLAQWDKRRSAERVVAGSNPGRTNTQGL